MSESITLSVSTEASRNGRSDSLVETLLNGVGWFFAVLLGCIVVALAWFVSIGDIYTPGSTLGYNLGLIGGLMMASLLFYPLRKRVPFFERFGKMEHWFGYHMVGGIAGPLLVLFHSTFKVGSMNGSVALYSMLAVAVSGIVGRFIYRHIYRGLSGQKITLREASAELEACVKNLGSAFELKPDIEPRLQAFKVAAFEPMGSTFFRLLRFLTLRLRSRKLGFEIRYDIKHALRHLHREKKLSRKLIGLHYRLAREIVDRYLVTVVRASQLAAWEHLFSLWHVVHVPFFYLLLISGIVHVIAVHMY